MCYGESVDIAPGRTANMISQHRFTKLNPKQKLHLIHEAPQTVLSKLFRLWKITHLVFEKDAHAYARDRNAEITKFAKEAGVEVIIYMGRTLYDP
jgi:hypothetical protein